MEAGALRAPAGLSRITVTSPLLRLRTDEQLVALFRGGSDAAFGIIHDRYRQRLFAYARQMLGGSRQDAEDALQDVFLRAYSSLRSNDRPLSLRAWLYRVAHNRCIDHLRKPSPSPVDLFDTSRRPLHDPIVEAERRDDLRRLVADVRRLPDQQRSALLMREIDGLSYAELGDALGVTLPAVKSLLVRARIGLVEAVEARDTACAEIRMQLVDAFDRGVRASGLARRHLRDCDGCAGYRAQLRGVGKRLDALTANPGFAAAAMKLLGLGGAGSAGAASAGGGASAGSALVAAGGGTATKVAAVVCCAALTAGGAAEVRSVIVHPARSGHGQRSASASAAAVSAAHRSAPQTAQLGAQRSSARAAAATRSASATRHAAATKQMRSLQGTTAGAARAPADGTVVDPATADPETGGATAPDEDTTTGYGYGGAAPLKPPPPDPAPKPVQTDPTAPTGQQTQAMGADASSAISPSSGSGWIGGGAHHHGSPSP